MPKSSAAMECTNCGFELENSTFTCKRCGAKQKLGAFPSLSSPLQESLRIRLQGVRDVLSTMSAPAPSPDEPPKGSIQIGEDKIADEVKALNYKIIVVKGSRAGEIFEVGRIITFGRGNQCEVQLHDISISREHVRIVYHPTRRVYLLQDLGSQNGALLNGIRMDRAELASGDHITIGSAEVVLYKRRLPDEVRVQLEKQGIHIRLAQEEELGEDSDDDKDTNGQNAGNGSPSAPAVLRVEKPANILSVHPAQLHSTSVDDITRTEGAGLDDVTRPEQHPIDDATSPTIEQPNTEKYQHTCPSAGKNEAVSQNKSAGERDNRIVTDPNVPTNPGVKAMKGLSGPGASIIQMAIAISLGAIAAILLYFFLR